MHLKWLVEEENCMIEVGVHPLKKGGLLVRKPVDELGLLIRQKK